MSPCSGDRMCKPRSRGCSLFEIQTLSYLKSFLLTQSIKINLFTSVDLIFEFFPISFFRKGCIRKLRINYWELFFYWPFSAWFCNCDLKQAIAHSNTFVLIMTNVWEKTYWGKKTKCRNWRFVYKTNLSKTPERSI